MKTRHFLVSALALSAMYVMPSLVSAAPADALQPLDHLEHNLYEH
nr:hypothetical protein [uncultured Albidiferax sp.]